jgi:uncharacterized protein (DUF302 family)
MSRHVVVAFMLFLAHGIAAAGPSFIQRDTDLDYPEAMSSLQQAVREAGYSLAFIQPVDRGLRRVGIDAGVYRVVHIDIGAQASSVLTGHPELAAHLPLRITLYARDDKLTLSALRPTLFAPDPEGAAGQILRQWEDDLESIIAAVE